MKIAPEIRAITGSFAPQGIKLVVMIVIRLSLRFSIVRVAIMPGTEQPVPISIGIKDFPERPSFLKILSITKAIRDIYPQASRKARKIKRTNIWGTKPSTAPTPPIMPSTTRLFSHSAQFIFSSPCSARTGIPFIHPL